MSNSRELQNCRGCGGDHLDRRRLPAMHRIYDRQ